MAWIISHRGCEFSIVGDESKVLLAKQALELLYEKALSCQTFSPQEVHMDIQGLVSQYSADEYIDELLLSSSKVVRSIATRNAGLITAKGANQLSYLNSMLTHDVNFGIGPAGTGKTFLAVLCAVEALEKERVSRIILVRPAVEAGESLGFLPGDFSQKS